MSKQTIKPQSKLTSSQQHNQHHHHEHHHQHDHEQQQQHDHHDRRMRLSSQDHISINLHEAFHQPKPDQYNDFHRDAMMDHRTNQNQLEIQPTIIPYYLISERNNTEDSQPSAQEQQYQQHQKQHIEQHEQVKIQQLSSSSSFFSRSYIKILVLLLTITTAIFLFNTQLQFVDLLKSLPQYSYSYPTRLHSSLWLKQYSDYMQTKQKQQQEIIIHQNQIIKEGTMKYYGLQTMKDRKQADMYLDIQGVIQGGVEQLPFCVFIDTGKDIEQNGIINSIMKSQYSNVVVLTMLPISPIYSTSTITLKQLTFPQSKKTHNALFTQMFQFCPLNSLITILNSPVHHNYFHKFNTLHQTWNTYLIYSKDNQFIQVHTFYIRIFQLLKINDFNKQSQEYLWHWDVQAITIGLLQLTKMRSKNIQRNYIFQNLYQKAYLQVNLDNQRIYKRKSYLPITRLSDDFPRDLYQDSKSFKRMFMTAELRKQSYIVQKNLSIQKMLKAEQQQDQIYLPYTHSLSRRQYQNYNKKYKIQKQLSLQKQLPLCVCVLSHNNVANNRYKKVILSILMQNYSNYHIVFFDDVSSDGTMDKTIKFIKQQMKFNEEKVIYVKNLQRKYATYNILNAAFNFCVEQDIQVLIDGDDQIIGTQVFQLLNGLYKADSNRWVMYTNFKTNNHQFGQSRPYAQKSQLITAQNTRTGGHFLGQLRSWKIPLIRTIPKKYHQSRFNQWLDTVYDDALQHSLFQLSSLQRVLYIPQICYEYNREYGDNDDSTEMKLTNRFMTYQYLLGLPVLKRLGQLSDAVVDREMQKYFKNQLKSKTFTYTESKQNQRKNENIEINTNRVENKNNQKVDQIKNNAKNQGEVDKSVVKVSNQVNPVQNQSKILPSQLPTQNIQNLR